MRCIVSGRERDRGQRCGTYTFNCVLLFLGITELCVWVFHEKDGDGAAMLMEKNVVVRDSPDAAFKKAYTTFPSLNSSSVWKTMSSSSTSSLGGIGPRLALSLPPLMDITCCRRVCFRAVPDIEAGLTSRRGPRCVRGSADASRTRMANKNQPILIFDCREAGILQNLVRQLSPTTPDLGQPVSSLEEARMDRSQIDDSNDLNRP